MDCCQCQGIEVEFGLNEARRKLRSYHKQGPDHTTQLLIDALKAEGVEGATLLDIGGGVGAVQHELLKAGALSALDVEASKAYFEIAQQEAKRQGTGDRTRYYHGDFVALAANIPPADVVTLDRVICCYHDMQALVGLSAAHAQKLYGLVYPRDTWWVRLGLVAENLWQRLRRCPFRAFVHATQDVAAILSANGLKPRYHRQTLLWQVAVYGR